MTNKPYNAVIQIISSNRTIDNMKMQINQLEGERMRMYSVIHAEGISTGAGTIGGQGPLKHFCIVDNMRHIFDTEDEMLVFLAEHFMANT